VLSKYLVLCVLAVSLIAQPVGQFYQYPADALEHKTNYFSIVLDSDTREKILLWRVKILSDSSILLGFVLKCH